MKDGPLQRSHRKEGAQQGPLTVSEHEDQREQSERECPRLGSQRAPREEDVVQPPRLARRALTVERPRRARRACTCNSHAQKTRGKEDGSAAQVLQD
eukprot:4479516-Pleurochrysis_carterae.AAC.2